MGFSAVRENSLSRRRTIYLQRIISFCQGSGAREGRGVLKEERVSVKGEKWCNLVRFDQEGAVLYEDSDSCTIFLMPRKKKVPAPELCIWSPFCLSLALMVFSYAFFRPQLDFLVVVLTCLGAALANSPAWKGMSAMFHTTVIIGSCTAAFGLMLWKYVPVSNPNQHE